MKTGFIEKVSLERYQKTGILGTGADYEVRAAVDQETGQLVVLKRPLPQMVSRQLHRTIEARTDRILQVYQEVAYTIPSVIPILGYTDRAIHDPYFGESLGQEYRVIVERWAVGIPLLVGDFKARILGVPVGVGQNLFTLFPLAHPQGETPFAVHQQLLDLEESFFRAGYVLLDLRPQNIFLQPASGRITVVDCGTLVTGEGRDPVRGQRRDIHDFYLEMLKFYTTPQRPPAAVSGYRDGYRLRPVVRFEEELNELTQQFNQAPDAEIRNAALPVIDQVRNRAYPSFEDFRRGLTAYLQAANERNQRLPDLPEARQTWAGALDLLRDDYWRFYLFDPATDLAGLSTFG
jgi:hypothetical protein